MKTVYADNNATTPVAPEVVEAMRPYLTDKFFNPSSMYSQASEVAAAVKAARRDIAALLGCADPSRIFFTSCATESNNWAILGAAAACPGRRHVITTAVEHPAVLEVCKDLARRGFEVTFLGVDRDGRLDTDEFIRALRKDTLLVTVMHANNETGVLFPVEDLSRIVKETDPGILFHTDATQSVGKVRIGLDGGFKHVDLLSFSGHKLHAPKGVGGLFVRKGTPLRPYLLGGHQEQGWRAGTENVPYIVGLAAACRLALGSFDEEERVRGLRDRLQRAVLEQIPYVEVNGLDAPRLPNTLNLACHYIEGESILTELDENGICASSGSACTSGSLEPSHVLKAMKVPFTAMHGSVRFSLSRYNTAEDVERIIEVFPRVVRDLRRLSPYWDQVRGGPKSGAPA
jgi:cysteine desulfurase